MSDPPRMVRVTCVQTGPASADVHDNLEAVRKLLAGVDPPPQLVVLPELFSRPFWCLGAADPRFFAWAEGVDGPTVSAARDLARELRAHVVTSFFERGAVAGEYYNSAAVIDPKGELVPGRLPSGRAVRTYRKCAVSAYRWDDQVNDEKFYFRPGPGFAVFPTELGVLGVLICYDRWFPEAWRVLALQGAELVCVVNASQGDVSDLFVPSMRTCAAQHQVHVAATNRGGVEELDGRRVRFYGLTTIVDPRGRVLAQGGEAIAGELVTTEVDLAKAGRDRLRHMMYRDRRPELYGLLVDHAAGGAP